MIHDWMTGVIQDKKSTYDKELELVETSMTNVKDAWTQISKLSEDIKTFSASVIEAAKEKLAEGDADSCLHILESGIEQMVKHISDRPTVITFELEKLAMVKSTLEFIQKDLDSVSEELDQCLKTKKQIKKELVEDVKSPKKKRRRKGGDRPERVKYERMVKAELIQDGVIPEEDTKE